VGVLKFTTTLLPRGPAAAIVLDDEQVAIVGEGAKRFPVAATINGYTWRSTIVRMRGEFLLGLSKATRAGAGVQAGDAVEVHLELDTAERVVELPEGLALALDADQDARAAYEALAVTHRREFARWVQEAKRKETRQRRIAQTVEMLHAGKTRS
jgi:hypothetical protein